MNAVIDATCASQVGYYSDRNAGNAVKELKVCCPCHCSPDHADSRSEGTHLQDMRCTTFSYGQDGGRQRRHMIGRMVAAEAFACV